MGLEKEAAGRYAPSMTRSWTIARIWDIDVRLHPTFALVFVWVLLDWRRLGGVQGAASIPYTLALVLLVFACVLLHEFGHAFMARQHGIRVHDVSLSAVGGVARMEQFHVAPRAEILDIAGGAGGEPRRCCGTRAVLAARGHRQWILIGIGLCASRL